MTPNSNKDLIDGKQWYVWTVKQGKFDIVSRYIEEKIPEIKEVLYPTITTERVTKKGERKKKKTPLYAGYVFLQYEHSYDNPSVWLKLNKHPFITRYVGPCTSKDLASVNSLQKIEKLNTEETKDFRIGDKIRVNGGVFKDMRGKVVGCSSSAVRVEISVFDRLTKAAFSPVDLDIIKREE